VEERKSYETVNSLYRQFIILPIPKHSEASEVSSALNYAF